MAIIKVDGFDLWTFTRITQGDGLDLSDADFIEPQFGDSGIGFGDPLLSIRSHNREIAIPIHLRSDTTSKDSLHAKVSDLNRRLAIAKQLEWRDDNATASTYLNIKFARFEPEFNKRRQDALWMSGVVRIYAEPYGRSVASGYSFNTGSFAGTGVSASISLASRITGDAPMVVRFEANTPSVANPFSHGRIIGGAIIPASYTSDWRAGSLVINDPDAWLMGASGAAGSQSLVHKAFKAGVSRSGTSYLPRTFAKLIITCASAYAGNNRVLAVANSEMNLGLARGGGIKSAASVTPMHGYGTLDLGVEYIDPNRGATHVIELKTTAPLQPETRYVMNSASATFRLNRIILLPEDTSALIVDDSRRRLLSQLLGTSSTATAPLLIDDLGVQINASSPYQSLASQYFRHDSAITGHIFPAKIATTTMSEFVATSSDISGELNCWFVNATAIIGLGKHTPDGDWHTRYTQVNASLGALSIIYTNASVAGSTVASTAFNNMIGFNDFLFLRMQQQGPIISAEAILHNGENDLVPGGGGQASFVISTISASVANVSGDGTPFLTTFGLAGGFSRLTFTEVPSVGLQPGDIYTLDSDTQTSLRRNSISVNTAPGLRGGYVTFFPDASKYNSAVVYNLPLDRSSGLNQPWSGNIYVNEQFTYSK